MRPIFAIGDIHGQLDRLHEALDYIAQDEAAEAPIVFLGDYVDRGPASRAVIELLMAGQAEGKPWTCLMGNHDRYILRFLDNPEYDDPMTTRPLLWTDPALGGDKTLASYGVDVDPSRSLADIRDDAAEAIPQSHLDWVANLPRYYETEDQIFVHAGIRPGVPLAEQAEDDLIWIRKGFLEVTDDYGKLVVHGHTALDHPQHYGNRLNLDGGAGYGRPLVPAVLLARDAFALGPKGRARL